MNKSMRALTFFSIAVLLAVARSVFGQGYTPAYDHSVSIQVRVAEKEEGRVRPLALPLPAYPSEMLHAHIGGDATVKLLVREDGSVTDVTLVASTQKEFGDPTKAAAAGWKFHPPKHRRTQAPVSVWVVCRVFFKMDEE